MIRQPRSRNSAGDTIVEVMIVLAILSLAFAISTATANRSLGQSRNSQEHSETLSILSSQVELLRTAVTQQTSPILNQPTPFCMSGAASKQFTLLGSINPDPNLDTFSSYPPECSYPASTCAIHQEPCYHESIVYTPAAVGNSSTDNYDIRIRWYGLGSFGIQQEETTYRVHPITADVSPGIQLSASTPQIKVVVKEIPPLPVNNDPNQDRTPSCNGSPTNDIAGSSVTLSQPGYPYSKTQTTNNQSSSLFSPLLDSGQYQATINSLPTPTSNPNPSGPSFTACSPTGVPATLPLTVPTPPATQPTIPGSTPVLSVSFIPQCYTAYSMPHDHTGPPDRWQTVYNFEWHHTGLDWGPGGFGAGYSTTGYTSWETAIGLWPPNDRPAQTISGPPYTNLAMDSSYGYGQTAYEGGGANMRAPSAGYTADGFVFYQDYDYGNGIPNNRKWYNRFEEVYTTSQVYLGQTDYGIYSDPYPVCPS